MGFTATPMGVAHIYPHLIIAGRNSDCRACGALVPARIYAPSELDTSKLKLQDNGEFNYEDVKSYCWTGAIFGHVLGSLESQLILTAYLPSDLHQELQRASGLSISLRPKGFAVRTSTEKTATLTAKKSRPRKKRGTRSSPNLKRAR